MTTTLTSEHEMIEVGDRVRVEFWQGKADICGDVVYLPMQAGDSWIVRSEDRLFYIQHFAAISKRNNISPRPPTVNTGRGRCIHNVPCCGDCEITRVFANVAEAERARNDAATSMRDLCVEAVKTKCGYIPFEDLIVLLESLTLDQVEQKQED